MEETKANHTNNLTEKDVKAPNIFERAKEEIEAIMHNGRPHVEETHGNRDDIDETTSVDEVKAPNLFERAKEEIEAVVETIHEKKDHHQDSSKRYGGFWAFLGRRFETFCSPYSRNRG